jgi:hypothetical protein
VKPGYLAAAALLAGCGYMGPPMAPTLDLPQRVTDLVVAERGAKILAQFTVPALTTEGLPLKSVRSVELRVGVPPNPWNQDVWAASAKRIDVPATEPGPLKSEVAAQEWIGKDVAIAVRATGPKGKTSDWSIVRNLSIQPPLATPQNLQAKNLPQGISITWRGSAAKYLLFRAVGDESPALLGDTEHQEYLDAPIEFGTRYRYYVQAVAGELQQSEVAGPQEITPEDDFSPAVPAGLTADLGTNAVELSWERNTEPRFQGYNVYRSTDGGPFEKIAPLITAPTYSDRTVQAGKKYQYVVSSVGVNGKESDRSAPVEITMQ